MYTVLYDYVCLCILYVCIYGYIYILYVCIRMYIVYTLEFTHMVLRYTFTFVRTFLFDTFVFVWTLYVVRLCHSHICILSVLVRVHISRYGKVACGVCGIWERCECERDLSTAQLGLWEVGTV